LLTEAGVVMGTMAYLSPEQARAEHVDARTDLFSFGAVLYEMATGRRAFPKALDWTTPPAESLPPELRSIVQKLLAPDRDLRYQSATDVAVDVRRCDAGRTPVSPGAVRAPGDSRPAAASWRRLSPVTLGVVAGATLVVVALVFFVPSTSPGDSPASIGSIAVLPLRNISGDPAQDYFADGMTDALITSLAKLQAFRVASRTSVMQFRDAARPLPDIARQLAVDGIVEGTVLRDGSFVRISVRLIDGRSDSGVWAESYDRDLGDVLMLQGDVARAIAAAVGATLSEQAAARLTGARPVNPEAYDTYLRARYAFSRVNEEDSLRAVALFERAIALDPGFAPAHAELGLANLYVFNFYRPGDAVWGERARAATERALSIDPDLAEARITRGRLVWTPGQGYQHVQAAREYRRALELNPSLDEARFQLSQVLGHSGLLDEALEVLSQIDPAFASGRIREAVAQARLYLGLHEEALTSLMEVPADYNPTLVGHEKAWALVALGRDDEALAVLDEYTREFPQDPAGTFDSVRALIHARRDNRGEAERLITVAIRKDRNSLQFHHTSYAVAAAYAGLGDHDDALTWLEFTAANGFPCGTLFEHDPNFEAIRRHPRFSRLLEAVRRQSNDLRALLAP
jgi:TolB-like protein